MIPHFAFPFRFSDNGSASVVVQDTLVEIEQNVKVLVLTDIGERLEVPEFGILNPTFDSKINTTGLINAAHEWDERAEVLMSERPNFFQVLSRTLLIQVEER